MTNSVYLEAQLSVKIMALPLDSPTRISKPRQSKIKCVRFFIFQMMPLMEECTTRLLEVCTVQAHTGELVDIHDLLQRLTLDVIDKCAFDLNINGILNPQVSRTVFMTCSSYKLIILSFCS